MAKKIKAENWLTKKEWGLKTFAGVAMLGVGLLLMAIASALGSDFKNVGKWFFWGGSVGLLVVAAIGFGKVGENYKKIKLILLGIVLGTVAVMAFLLWI